MKDTEIVVLALAVILGTGLIVGGAMVMGPWSPLWGSPMTTEDDHGMMGDEDSMMGDEDSMIGDEDEDHEEFENWEEPTGKLQEVSITAYYWRFEPSAILVSENDTVRLTISSVNNMMPMMARIFPNHGIAIEEYGLNYTLPVGETVTIEFVATKNGEVHFHCSIYCGVGHEDMHGELIVNGVDSTHIEPSNVTTVNWSEDWDSYMRIT